MRTLVFLSLLSSVLFLSCNRTDNDILGQQSEPLLIRTVARDSLGRLVRVVNYNTFGIVSDTIYSPSSGAIIMNDIYEYNSKGKRLSWEHYLPIAYKAGYYNRFEFLYENDTLLKVDNTYGMGGKLTIKTRHFYNAAGVPAFDSMQNFISGTNRALLYDYDAQRRMLSTIVLEQNGDTVTKTLYHYTGNTTEKESTVFSTPLQKTVIKAIAEYTADGKVLSEKSYQAGQATGQTDYTYDASGRLTRKQATNSSGVVTEDTYTYDNNGGLKLQVTISGNNRNEYVYTNNSLNGKPEKMEYYANGRLSSVTTFYYQ